MSWGEEEHGLIPEGRSRGCGFIKEHPMLSGAGLGKLR